MTTSPSQFASSLTLANPSLVFVKISGLYLMWQWIHMETARFEAIPPCLPPGGMSLRTEVPPTFLNLEELFQLFENTLTN